MEDSLKPAERREAALATVLRERGEKRLDAILASGDPFGVVGSLAKAELFFTYAELDEELHRQVLLRLATAEQVDYLLDLDLWDGDRLDADRALEWVGRILGAGDKQALGWLLRAEQALLVSLIQNLADVYEGPAASEMALSEAQDALPPFTVEGLYFLHFHSKEGERGLRRLFILLASEHLEYYIALLQDVMGASSASKEEDALQDRWRRLRDEGIEPPEMAYEVYRRPTKEELSALSDLSSTAAVNEADEELAGAPTALALAAPTGLLAAALERLQSPRDVDRLSQSIAWTSNLVLSADHMPLSDIGAHTRALEKTMGYLSIGLHDASGGDVGRATEVLARANARLLFRVGYQKVSALGSRAARLRSRGWLSQLGLGLEVLDSPVGETVKALARARPRYPSVLSGESEDRELRDAGEVARCAEVLDRAEALGALFIDGLGLSRAAEEGFDLTGCNPSDVAELTLGLILRTAVARLVLDGQMQFAPIDARELPKLRSLLFDGGAISPRLRERSLEALRPRLEGASKEQLDHVQEFLAENIDIIGSSFEDLEPGAHLVPRFVGAVIIRDAR